MPNSLLARIRNRWRSARSGRADASGLALWQRAALFAPDLAGSADPAALRQLVWGHPGEAELPWKGRY
ncbi:MULTISPECIES: hypothetical protein [unclassified Nocardia]|uniref:hypothetical protein n=1 Tax=unclassified Nocardia TaxID=2637762 RepID=UPI001CE41B2A|nr:MULTISPECIES: hypothetical protein [unclassified Nocardia]